MQRLRDSDLQQYQQQVAAFEQELSQALEERNEAGLLGEQNQNLALELEKEKGRLAGTFSSHEQVMPCSKAVKSCPNEYNA